MKRTHDELIDQAPPSETAPDFFSPSSDQPGVIETELLLHGRQVTGEIRYGGVARRLIDLLNSLDNGYLTMHTGTLRDCSDSCLEFDLIQVARNSIVVAFPRQGSTARINPGEFIQKDRRLVTVIMPGCQVSGYFHVAPGIDPSVVTASAANRFVALTDVTVTAFDTSTPTRFEPIAVLNTTHAEAYVWSDEAKSLPSRCNAGASVADEPTVPSNSPVV